MASLAPRLDSYEKNVLINGNFDYWQRGNATTTPASGGTHTYWADRWQIFRSVTGAVDISRDTDVPTRVQSGFQSRYSQKIVCSTAQASISSGQFLVFRQPIEGLNLHEIIARKATLTFWVKSSMAPGTVMSVAFNIGGAVANWVSEYTINASNTWEQKIISVDFTQASAFAFPLDESVGLYVDFNLAIGPDRLTTQKNQWIAPLTTVQSTTTSANFLSSTSNTLWLSQIQLVPNDLTTIPGIVPIFHRSAPTIQAELAACQRYYEKSYDYDTPPGGGGTSSGQYMMNTSNGGGLFPVAFRVTKRVVPPAGSAFRVYAGNSGTVDAVRDNSALNDKAVSYSGNGANASINGFSVYVPTYTTGAYILFHWVADAEMN